MAGEQKYRTLTKEELDEIAGEELPEQAAIALVNARIAIPIDTSAGADANAGPIANIRPNG